MKTTRRTIVLAALAAGLLAGSLAAADARADGGPGDAPKIVPAAPAEQPAQPAPAKEAQPAKAPADKPAEKNEEKKADDPAKKPDKEKAKETAKPAPPKPKLPPIPKWERPEVADVRAKVFAWLDGKNVDAATRAKVEQIWSFDPKQVSGTELLVRVAASYGVADQEARKLVEVCSHPRIDFIPPSFPWLLDPKTDKFMADNLRLLYGRWLAHELLYDETLEMLAGLNAGDVADPASLLFYQSVVYHFFLDQDNGLRTIDGLLLSPEHTPRRYVALASLMREDLKALKDDSLDHIARRMRDVQRRLDLGTAGRKVRTVEDGIVESLDKLIKKLEEQQQQGGGGGGAGGNNIRSSSPAPDSRIIGGKGQGEVTKRDIGAASGWGNLPPKEREEALQAIGRDFPSHYRDKIEHYFRKLASETEEPKK